MSKTRLSNDGLPAVLAPQTQVYYRTWTRRGGAIYMWDVKRRQRALVMLSGAVLGIAAAVMASKSGPKGWRELELASRRKVRFSDNGDAGVAWRGLA
ncbi:hypothetical protein LZ32DRAFT_604718 [Colletotrichum eremochloae]|nr:hypothetical protein LZ32DRAFT_604718 [Colletotrichum eremochloae]